MHALFGGIQRQSTELLAFFSEKSSLKSDFFFEF